MGSHGESGRDEEITIKIGPVRVYKLAYLSTLTGPYFACDFSVTSRLTAHGSSRMGMGNNMRDK